MDTLNAIDLKERVAQLNSLILEGKILEAFDLLYAENVIMQENEDMPTVGKAANRLNEEAFVANITEFRKANIKNVIISDDISVVEWDFDFTHKEWGVRNYTQVAVQRWNKEGQIINEKFLYNN